MTERTELLSVEYDVPEIPDEPFDRLGADPPVSFDELGDWAGRWKAQHGGH